VAGNGISDDQGGGLNFDSSNLIATVKRWWRPLMIVAGATSVLSAGFSFIITPKFKSTVILFPTNTASISKALLAQNTTGKEDLLEFGEEEQAEQMIQILESDEIRRRVIEKFDLMQHYEIDSTDKFKYTKLNEEFESNISFNRTEFQSVRIDVYDSDPQLAALIANDIAALLDSVKNRMQQERAHKAMTIAEAEYVEMKNYIQSLEDSLNNLRLMGVNDYESMSERFNEYYAKALLEGNTRASEKLAEQLKILSRYGGAYVSIRDILEHEKKQLSHLRAKYQEAKVDAEQTLPHKFVVNTAVPAEKKSYPIRWLIVVVSTISSLLLSIIVILAYESLRKIGTSTNEA
jgi:uncharacterized protein involved in exopolysaccharide biosynthesis